jgi:hypothetical protein
LPQRRGVVEQADDVDGQRGVLDVVHLAVADFGGGEE